LLQQNFWLQQQKKIFVVPNFVAVTKTIFFCAWATKGETQVQMATFQIYRGKV